jgi:DNA-binding LytR/AlgR family response regulator
MRIAICDDEREFITGFSRIVDKLYRSLDMTIDEFADGTQLLKSFSERRYDIVFLDIEMPKIDGITLARKLRELSEDVYIVFLTGHIEYAVKGYEVNALRYLTKPVTDDDIHRVFEYVIKKQNSARFIWIKNKETERRVPLNEILYIDADGQNIVINTANASYSIRGNLNDYEASLKNDGFFRTHRSYLVSMSKIMCIEGKNAILAGGCKVPIARAKESEFREAFMSFINKEAF